MKPSYCILTLALVLHFSAGLRAQQVSQKYLRETGYLLSLPQGYEIDKDKKWPLMIFLHGSGEVGTDLEKVKVNGPPKLLAKGKKFPLIVVSPQAKEDEDGWDPEQLYHLVTYLKKTYQVDQDRIYLTGLSMGGFGTWTLATNHPDEFAAIVPICGGGDTSRVWRLRYMPVWCFHGALDNVVPVSRDQQMMSKLSKYNSRIKFTVYPDVYHNSWEKAYENDSLYEWLLTQKKFKYQEIKVERKKLDSYVGRFVSSNGDTIKLSVDSIGLRGTAQNTFPLKPAGNETFFISENMLVELRFNKTRKGIYDSFTVFEREKTVFRRIK